MAITITRDFAPGDRYRFDFQDCTTEKGWAQVDTSQDASYYGNWVNPFNLALFCYCEGDLIHTQCETAAELVQQLTEMKAWNTSQGHRFIGIDPGFNVTLDEKLVEVGLSEFFHEGHRPVAVWLAESVKAKG